MNLKRLKAGWDEKYLSQLLQNNNFNASALLIKNKVRTNGKHESIWLSE